MALLAHRLMWLTPLVVFIMYFSLRGEWENHSQGRTTCGKEMIPLTEGEHQQSLTGMVVVTSDGGILLGQKGAPRSKVVVLPCGDEVEVYMHAMADNAISDEAPGNLLEMRLQGRCLAGTECWTFLVEDAWVTN